MKISRLERAQNYRIFRDFSWPPTGLPDFAQFNVIYGWNGAGKTTLSNIFQVLQRRTPLTEGAVDLLVDATIVHGKDFGTATLPDVRTFNRDTVVRSVFEAPNRHLPPVFFLGEDTVEKQREVEHLSAELDQLQVVQTQRDARQKLVTSEFDTFCTEEARGTKNLLTVAGGGPYNNYNAANFKADAATLADAGVIVGLLPKVRKAYLEMKDEKPMPAIALPKPELIDVQGLTVQTQRLLSKSIVSSIIAELANEPQVGSWVQAGLALHTGTHDSSACRFCTQPLPQGRIAALEAHFNDEFQGFIRELDTAIANVARMNEVVRTRPTVDLPPKEALYANLRPTYERALNTWKSHWMSASATYDILLRALRAKRDEPFRELSITHFITNLTADGGPPSGFEVFMQVLLGGTVAVGAVVGQTTFDQLISLIKEHNTRTAGFDAEVKKAREALLREETLRALPKWRALSKDIANLAEDGRKAAEKVDKLKRRIGTLNSEIRQHRQPAEELNKEIAAYLGRDELRFQPEQNGYVITRGDQPATHLSDGERTAIAFLYFLKSLKAADFDLTKGIVVIDDPVSSLDANSMFSAFAFLKERTASAGQLFVLTHNFTFFRQVRSWFYNMPGQKKGNAALRPARFYMLTSQFDGGRRSSRLEDLDPFLHQYESEYHYLFKRIHEEANRAVPAGLESYYALPNVARRLLEAFLAFRVPDKPGDLYQKLEATTFDQAKKIRILRFLHTYSHLDGITEPHHDIGVLSETPAVLKDLLALIRHCDEEHFNGMTALVQPTPAGTP